uniref:Mediator of RNA polymerase II transcription subunit 7 n=1 Tax=Phallusia mammillata TaxID=59560 RepID=A0A6F9DL86_9ASCI|nr:mediator of RNA polymerase II transcription subunit 7-like [Phallusia mammillata]
MSNITQPNMEAQIQSAMPLPVMKYVNQYTDDAVKRKVTPKPPVPIKESYQMFGQTCHQDDIIIRPLEAQGLLRLHPEPYSKREELKKMTVSILCNFLDLLDILVKSGTTPGRDQKIEDLNLLFIHMHHLINEFRPHQARETLKVMMNMQKKQMVDAGEKLCKHIEKASEILRQCSEDLVHVLLKPSNNASTVGSVEDTPMEIDNLLASSLPVMGKDGTGNAARHTNHVDSNQDDKDVIMCNMVDGIND